MPACAALRFGLILIALAQGLSARIAALTYLGGSRTDAITSIALDKAGFIYVAGWTESSDLRVVNAAQPYLSGGVDAFVAKMSADGKTLVYCTYLGGRGDDRAFGIAVDAAGNAYVTGWTTSTDFPTLNPLQGSPGGAKMHLSRNSMLEVRWSFRLTTEAPERTPGMPSRLTERGMYSLPAEPIPPT